MSSSSWNTHSLCLLLDTSAIFKLQADRFRVTKAICLKAVLTCPFTTVAFNIPHSHMLTGIDMKSPDELKKIDRKVEAKVKGMTLLPMHAMVNLQLSLAHILFNKTIIKLFINRDYRQFKD